MRYQVGDKMRYYEPSTFAHARWRVDLSTGEAIK